MWLLVLSVVVVVVVVGGGGGGGGVVFNLSTHVASYFAWCMSILQQEKGLRLLKV